MRGRAIHFVGEEKCCVKNANAQERRGQTLN